MADGLNAQWTYLPENTAGRFNPEENREAQGLAHLRDCLIDRFGSLDKAFQQIEAVNKPVITRNEFWRLCHEINLAWNWKTIYGFLDKKETGSVHLKFVDAKLGEKYEEEKKKADKAQYDKETEQLAEKAKTFHAKRRQAILEAIGLRHPNPIICWADVLDLRVRGKINFREFGQSCATTGYKGPIADIWHDMGLKEDGHLRFEDLYPNVGAQLKKFYEFVRERTVDLIKDVESRDPAAAKSMEGVWLRPGEFAKLCEEVKWEGKPEEMAELIDPFGDGNVSTRGLRCLRECINDDLGVIHFCRRYKQRRKLAFQEDLAARVLPSCRETLAEQDSFIETQKGMLMEAAKAKKLKEDFLQSLRKQYNGNLVKAWVSALDKKREMVVPDMPSLLKGLKKAGLEPKGSRQDMKKKLEDLWNALLTPGSVAVKLTDIEPRVPVAIERFKELLTGRFVTLWQAFDAVDREESGTLTRREFQHLCAEIKFQEGYHLLVAFYDPDNEDAIALNDIDPEAARRAYQEQSKRKELAEARLQKIKDEGREYMYKQPPPLGEIAGAALIEKRKEERKSAPSLRLLEELKSKLIHKHGTLLRAWRKVMNPTRQRQVGQEAMYKAFENVRMDVEEYFKAWNALGLSKETATLEDFDPTLTAELKLFRECVLNRWGNFSSAFKEVDPEATGEIDRQAFLYMCYEGHFQGNEGKVFEYLDSEGTNKIALRAIDRKTWKKILEEKKARTEKDIAPPPASLEKRKSESDSEDEEKAQEEADEQDKSDRKVKRAAKKRMPWEAKPPPTRPPSAPLAEGCAPPSPRSKALVKTFREIVSRNFGSSLKVWFLIDKLGQGQLTKSEFADQVRVTGFAGSPSQLWKALVGDGEWICFRDVDPLVFHQMMDFRVQLEDRLGGLDSIFLDRVTGEYSKTLDEEAFFAICKRIECPKPWDWLFYQFDVKSAGFISWEDASWLEEAYNWKVVPPASKRLKPKPRKNLSEGRTQGLGPLALGLPSPSVRLLKSTSLPSLAPPRPTWNDRHQIVDTPGNKELQLLHNMLKVQTQGKEILDRRLEAKLQAMPIADWVMQHLEEREREEQQKMMMGIRQYGG